MKIIFLIILAILDIGFIPRFSSYNVVNKIVVIVSFLITAWIIQSIIKENRKKVNNKKSGVKAPVTTDPDTFQDFLTDEQFLQQLEHFLKWCKRNTRFLPDNHYPPHMKTDWGIETPALFHHQLLQAGYLEEMSLEQRVRHLKVVELKQILKKLGLPVSGKKDELIQRVLENGDFDSILSVIGEQPEFGLTQKAHQFLFEYYDMMSLKFAQRDLQGYQLDNVEKYQILAILDNKTCEYCGKMDRKIFLVTDAKIGVNMPPFHDGCRCTTTPYWDGEDLSKRTARDADGKYIDVPVDMTYDEWKKTFMKQN